MLLCNRSYSRIELNCTAEITNRRIQTSRIHSCKTCRSPVPVQDGRMRIRDMAGGVGEKWTWLSAQKDLEIKHSVLARRPPFPDFHPDTVRLTRARQCANTILNTSMAEWTFDISISLSPPSPPRYIYATTNSSASSSPYLRCPSSS